jgi:hypothetical protein
MPSKVVGGPSVSDFLLTYTDAAGVQTVRPITPRSIEQTKGGPVLNAICLTTHSPRTFQLAQIRSLADLQTGEVVPSVAQALAPFAPDGFDFAAIGSRRVLRRAVGEPEAFVREWAFKVPMPAFAAALDILALPRKSRGQVTLVWSQGEPPAYEFMPGDTFHSSEMIGANWAAEAVRGVTLQVVGLHQDQLLVKVFSHANASSEERLLSPAALAKLLQVGL